MASDNRMRDPYAILGISRTADQLEIKAAWRNVAKRLHPDQNRNDPLAQTRFTEAGRAYELLKDPDKRRRYDEMLNRSSYGSGATSAYAPGRSGSKEPTFMEKRAERARAEAEARARAEAEARLRAEAEAEARAKAAAEYRAKAEAEPKATDSAKPAATTEVDEETEQAFTKIFGDRRKAERTTEKPAESSAQSAPKPEPAKAESAKTESSRTDSAGAEAPKATEHATQQDDTARTADAEPSDPQTEGAASPALNLISYLVKRLTGQVPPPERAPDLNIDAMVSVEDLINRVNPAVTLPDGKLLSITLPDGAMDGTTVRIEGYGHKLPNMRRGDVVATLRLKPHRWYRTNFYDLHTFHDIDIENAVLGCDATVETPDGPVRIKVPAWSGSNKTVTVPGKGLPKGNGLRGDLVVEIRVMLWDHPDEKVIDLMRSLREGLFL